MVGNLVHGEQYWGHQFYVLNICEFQTPNIPHVTGGSQCDGGYKPTWESPNTNV